MSRLQISLLGGLQVTRGDTSELKLPPAAQTLFAFLVLNCERGHRRDLLVGLFWGGYDEERARGCLSSTLWRLRCLLEPSGIPRGSYLVTTPTADGLVSFNSESDYWLDVAAFEEDARQGMARTASELEAEDVQALEEAVRFYTGDLMVGFYDDWILRERERLRQLYLNSLARLMSYYRHHHLYEKSLAFAQRILAIDPLREEVHREVMRIYMESDCRALAVQQYKACREILSEELGIPPMEETQALYHQIVPVKKPPETAVYDGGPDTLEQALRQLNLAILGLEGAQRQLQQSIQIVKQFTHYRSREP